MSMIYYFIVFLFIIEKESTNSLQLSKLVVPSVKQRGENALLECQYELNNRTINNKLNLNKSYNDNRRHYKESNYLYYDSSNTEENIEEILYSVKWYKDGEEFFRYVPKARQPQNSYSFDGIKVDHKRSNSFKVYLKNVSLKTSGIYKCEVSLEGPSFSTVQAEGYMMVVYLPNDGPFMKQGEKQEYQLGDKLNLNCSSAKSFPASQLQFFINDNPITNPKYAISYPDVLHAHGLICTTIGLNMRINSQYFEDGAMRIKCIASISPMIWSGNKETVIQQQGSQRLAEIPLPSIDTREVMFLVKSSAITIKPLPLVLSVNILFLKLVIR